MALDGMAALDGMTLDGEDGMALDGEDGMALDGVALDGGDRVVAR